MGIEPTCSAWKADILPLNYTCDCQTFVNQPLNYITGKHPLSRFFQEKTKNYSGAGQPRKGAFAVVGGTTPRSPGEGCRALLRPVQGDA